MVFLSNSSRSHLTEHMTHGNVDNSSGFQPGLIVHLYPGDVCSIWRQWIDTWYGWRGYSWHPVGFRSCQISCSTLPIPPTKNYLAVDVNGPEVERTWARSLQFTYQLSTPLRTSVLRKNVGSKSLPISSQIDHIPPALSKAIVTFAIHLSNALATSGYLSH